MIETICPHCGYQASDHTNLDDDSLKIKEGDIAFCINCGEFNTLKNGKFEKQDIGELCSHTQTQMRDIERAWLKTRNLKGVARS